MCSCCDVKHEHEHPLCLFVAINICRLIYSLIKTSQYSSWGLLWRTVWQRLKFRVKDDKVGEQYQWFSNSFVGYKVLGLVFYSFIWFFSLSLSFLLIQPFTITTVIFYPFLSIFTSMILFAPFLATYLSIYISNVNKRCPTFPKMPLDNIQAMIIFHWLCVGGNAEVILTAK